MSKDMQVQLDGIQAEMSGMRQCLDDVQGRLGSVEGRLGSVEGRLDSVERTLHKVVVAVAGHTEQLVRVEGKLQKLDLLDKMAQTMDALAGELKSSRAERVLSDQSFREQQATLLDHEVRIHRLERNAKPS